MEQVTLTHGLMTVDQVIERLSRDEPDILATVEGLFALSYIPEARMDMIDAGAAALLVQFVQRIPQDERLVFLCYRTLEIMLKVRPELASLLETPAVELFCKANHLSWRTVTLDIILLIPDRKPTHELVVTLGKCREYPRLKYKADGVIQELSGRCFYL